MQIQGAFFLCIAVLMAAPRENLEISYHILYLGNRVFRIKGGMKIRESGMPDEEIWENFFSPDFVLTRLGLTSQCGDVVDFGCGYGTFSIAAALIVRGVVHALDIEQNMIEATMARAKISGLTNVESRRCDIHHEGTHLPQDSVDYVMLFNILHAEFPVDLLREAFRILHSGRRAGIMHWRYDPLTPRGPSMDIRPKPEDCLEWARAAGFEIDENYIDLPPYHYGIILKKGENV